MWGSGVCAGMDACECANIWRPEVFSSPTLQLDVSTIMLRFYVGAEDLNSGLHAYMVSTLSTEPSSKPLVLKLT